VGDEREMVGEDAHEGGNKHQLGDEEKERREEKRREG
jgi:hypothetical protein